MCGTKKKCLKREKEEEEQPDGLEGNFAKGQGLTDSRNLIAESCN